MNSKNSNNSITLSGTKEYVGVFSTLCIYMDKINSYEMKWSHTQQQLLVNIYAKREREGER